MPEHKTKVKQNDDPDFANLYGEAWDVTCSCGWATRRSTEARAKTSADEHQANPDTEAE